MWEHERRILGVGIGIAIDIVTRNRTESMSVGLEPTSEPKAIPTPIPTPSVTSVRPAVRWLWDTLDTVGGGRFLAIGCSLFVHSALRPEGPPGNSPGRQAGVGDFDGMSAEGAALSRQGIVKYRAFGARFSTTMIPALRPGLFTYGPSGLMRHP